jgi:hypothetical protein
METPLNTIQIQKSTTRFIIATVACLLVIIYHVVITVTFTDNQNSEQTAPASEQPVNVAK